MEIIKSSDNQLSDSNLSSSNNKIDFPNLIENKIDYNKYKKYFTNKNIFLFFLSQFGFSFIILVIIIMSKHIPKYHKSKEFISKNTKSFNSNEEPKIFLHITDIHLSKTRPAKTDGSLLFLSSILNYEPDFIVMTGDLVDNFRGEFHWHRVGIQNDDDWNIINNIYVTTF